MMMSIPLESAIPKRGNEMSKTEVLARLRQLHEDLAAINDNCKHSDQVDEQTIDALGQLITDIGQILDRDQAGSPDASANLFSEEGLVERVQNFESQHPLVGRFLNQVSDLLGNMGI
jgi:hypothetical protein